MSVRSLSRLAVAAAGLALAACSTPPPAPLVQADVAATPRPDRVVVAPLNVAVRAPAELGGKGEPVWQQLLTHFQERNQRLAVISPISAERLWLEATIDLDVSDRSAALRAGYSGFARALAAHRDFDRLVVPSLVLRPARLSGWHASWDGAHRPVPHLTTVMPHGTLDVSGPTTMQVQGLRGKITAVSLHVVVLDPDGTWLYEGLGGLDLLQEAEAAGDVKGDVRLVLRDEPFADANAIRDGVERAFREPTLAAAPAR